MAQAKAEWQHQNATDELFDHTRIHIHRVHHHDIDGGLDITPAMAWSRTGYGPGSATD
jgi:hypothetical protein